MQDGFKRPWENDSARWWVVGLLGGIWILIFLFFNSPSDYEREISEEFAFRRVAESVTLQYFAGSGFPASLGSVFGYNVESLQEDTAQVFDESLEDGTFPESTAADWAVMFDEIGDSLRARKAADLIDVSRPDGSKRRELVESLIEDREASEAALAWSRSRYIEGTSGLPTWLLLRDEEEEIREWMTDRGTAILWRGMFANVLAVGVALGALVGGLVFLLRRKQLRFSKPDFRIKTRGWCTSYVLREFFIAEILGAVIAFGVGIGLGILGLGGLAWMLSVTAVFVVPVLWLSYRLTPGFFSSVRVFRIWRSGWKPRQMFAFTSAGLCLLAAGVGILLLIERGGDSLSDSISSGELDSALSVWWGFVLAVVLAPIGEEWLFRGFLYGGLRRQFGSLFSAVFSSGCFAVLHGYSWMGLLVVFLYGLVFCWLYQRSGSLLPGILAHAIYNGVVTIQMVSWFSLH